LYTLKRYGMTNQEEYSTKKQYNELEIGALAFVFKKKIETIQRWIENESIMLTTIKAISVIEKVKMLESNLYEFQS
jgi:hypothetical protein